jgi:hypothetical protein
MPASSVGKTPAVRIENGLEKAGTVAQGTAVGEGYRSDLRHLLEALGAL